MKPLRKSLVVISLLVILSFSNLSKVFADSPFTTIEQVQQMIADALAPALEVIENLSSRLTTAETTLSPIPTEIQGLQLSSATMSAAIAGLQARVSALENSPQLITTTIIPYLATGYRFKVVSFGEGAGFEPPGFDDSAFSVGGAGFGGLSSCPLNDSANTKTHWPLSTDILLRKSFNLPSGAKNLKVEVAIDNDVQVFINGVDISGGLKMHEGCAGRGNFAFSAANNILLAGANTIAVRGRDRGGQNYLDIQVTADTPQ